MLQHDHVYRWKNAGSRQPHVDLATRRTLHTAQLLCAVFTPFYPIFTPVLPQWCSFYPVFTPVLPQWCSFYPVFTPILPTSPPNFYPVFTLIRRVKSHVYPKFTPVPRFLPRQAFYPKFSTLRTLFTPILPRGKTGLFLLVTRQRRYWRQLCNSRL